MVLGLEVNPSTIHRFLLKEGLAQGRSYRRPRYQDTAHKGLHNVDAPGTIQMGSAHETEKIGFNRNFGER